MKNNAPQAFDYSHPLWVSLFTAALSDSAPFLGGNESLDARVDRAMNTAEDVLSALRRRIERRGWPMPVATNPSAVAPHDDQGQ